MNRKKPAGRCFSGVSPAWKGGGQGWRAPLAAPGGADLGAWIVNERARRTRGRGSGKCCGNEKGRDAGHRGLYGRVLETDQPILLNSDIDCICEKIVCAACSAVLCNWYWLRASA